MENKPNNNLDNLKYCMLKVQEQLRLSKDADEVENIISEIKSISYFITQLRAEASSKRLSIAKDRFENTLSEKLSDFKRKMLELKEELREAAEPKEVQKISNEIWKAEESMRQIRSFNRYQELASENQELKWKLDRLPINGEEHAELKKEFEKNTEELIRLDKIWRGGTASADNNSVGDYD